MRNITGHRIQQLRRERKLTQEDLAVRLQIVGLSHTRNTVAKMENGFRQITDIELRAIADVLGVNISALFEKDETGEDSEASFA